MRQDSGVDGDAQRISQLCWMFFLKIIDDQDQQLELMQDGYRSPIPADLRWRTWPLTPRALPATSCLVSSIPSSFLSSKSSPWPASREIAAESSAMSLRTLQLHEVWPVAAAGGQQDQRGRLQQPG